MAENRLAVFPSRMVLTALKDRMVAARTGHELLKKKSDAIKARLQRMLKEILETKRRCVEEIKNSSFSHTEAQWAAGNFNDLVIENVKEATYRVKGSIANVAGVKLPIFERNTEGGTTRDKDLSLIGLSKGGSSVAACRESFTNTLNDLVSLASLQTSLKTLDEALKVTNRRVNALEFVVMPQLNNTIKYVLSELDELEREDQYRIKKVKDLRQREEDEELEQKRLEEENAPVDIAATLEMKKSNFAKSGPGSATKNLLDAGKKTFAVDELLSLANADDGEDAETIDDY